MFASWPGNMRGPRGKTTLPLLVLLMTTLTGTALCQDYSEMETETITPEEDTSDGTHLDEGSTSTTSDVLSTTLSTESIFESSSSGTAQEISSSMTTSPVTDPMAELIPTIILIPVVLVVLIILMIVFGIFLKRRWSQQGGNADLRKDDPYLGGSSAEKVPMPMFEDDVPSVLELEMEELDQWMKKDG